MNRNSIIGIVVGIFVLLAVGGIPAGFSINILNGEVTVQGGTSVQALFTACILLFTIILFYKEKAPQQLDCVASVWRRLLALFIDFVVSMFAISGIIGIIPAWIEYLATREFSLYFQRDFLRATDWTILYFAFSVALIWMVAYFGYPFKSRKQTIGNCITKTIVVSTDSVEITWSKATFRLLLVFLSVCGWFITLILRRDNEGRYWHERVSKTKVLLVE